MDIYQTTFLGLITLVCLIALVIAILYFIEDPKKVYDMIVGTVMAILIVVVVIGVLLGLLYGLGNLTLMVENILKENLIWLK